MRKIPLSTVLRYKFDNTMSKGTPALIAWLMLVTAIVVSFFTSILMVTQIAPLENDQPIGVAKGLWNVLMRSMDAGTVAGDSGSWSYLLLMLAVTFFGIFIFSTLIGILTSGIEAKLDELRKGRSFVVEQDHTVILGWSTQVFTIISELMVANENRKKPAIVILSEKDKVEMEDEIRDRLGNTGNTRVVCRNGIPMDPNDLEIVNTQDARSIIILAPEEASDPDSHVIKSILAITNSPNRKKEPYHIVAAIHSPKNMAVAKMVGGDEVELVLGEDLISRISVQTCRQSGLSIVYTELLDFDGDEIYFQAEPALAGKTYGEALMAFEESALMGLRRSGGEILINPPMDTQLAKDDKVIVIARDDDAIKLSGLTDFKINTSAIQLQAPGEKIPEKTLVLGWNHRGFTIIHELEQYVAPGSLLTIVADVDDHVAQEILVNQAEFKHQNLVFERKDTTDRDVLDSLKAEDYDHIITMSYSDDLEPQEADAKSLVTLLHLRDIAEKLDTDFAIVSEMLDTRNRDLASVTQADDFIVSDKLISLMLSQLSENKELGRVFDDLFQADGSEIYLKPVTEYLKLDQPVNFYTVAQAASQRGETAIGYRIVSLSSDSDQGYGVKVNPAKSEMITFTAEDKVIVLAED